jgi:soluble lytic murein transglycosylase-like protein
LTAGPRRVAAFLLLVGLLPMAGWQVDRSFPRPDLVRMELGLDDYHQRAREVHTSFDQFEEFYAREIQPMAEFAYRHNGDRRASRRLAWAVWRTAAEENLDVHEILAIMHIESEFRPRARSFVGAAGLMQVMPFHAGRWGCGTDLYDIDVNVCSGARIYNYYLRTSPDVRTALLRYNGCVHGTNTPDCHQYPDKVERRIRMVRRALGANTS